MTRGLLAVILIMIGGVVSADDTIRTDTNSNYI